MRLSTSRRLKRAICGVNGGMGLDLPVVLTHTHPNIDTAMPRNAACNCTPKHHDEARRAVIFCVVELGGERKTGPSLPREE